MKLKFVHIVGVKIKRKKDIINKRKLYALILLFLLYMAIAGATSTYEDYQLDLFPYILFLSLIDLIIFSAVNMFFPFIYRFLNKNLIEYNKGKKICLWNAIIIFLISYFYKSMYGEYIIGWIPIVVYYFVNMWIFVKPSPQVEKEYLLPKEKLSNKIYYYIQKGADSIYKILKEENYNIDNQDNYFFKFLSSLCCLYFYKLSLTLHYSENDISFIVNDCLNKIINSITDDLQEKSEFLDICNDIFYSLDLYDKNSVETFPAKFFIATLEQCDIDKVSDSSILPKLSTYFFSLLEYKIYEL